jgi:tripartite-type tricarboxylate transporter receptor subunit TctC
MQNLIGGHIQIMFDAISTSLPHIRAGSIKPLGIASTSRSTLLPEVPTIAESGVPGYESTGWLALFAPAGTPPEIVRRLSDEARLALNVPAVRDKQVALGAEIVASTPQQLDETVRAEIAKWSKLVKAIGVSPGS